MGPETRTQPDANHKLQAACKAFLANGQPRAVHAAMSLSGGTKMFKIIRLNGMQCIFCVGLPPRICWARRVLAWAPIRSRIGRLVAFGTAQGALCQLNELPSMMAKIDHWPALLVEFAPLCIVPCMLYHVINVSFAAALGGLSSGCGCNCVVNAWSRDC